MERKLIGVTKCRVCNRKLADVYLGKGEYSLNCQTCGNYQLYQYSPQTDKSFRNPLALLFRRKIFRRYAKDIESGEDLTVTNAVKIILPANIELTGHKISGGRDVITKLWDGFYRIPSNLIRDGVIDLRPLRADTKGYKDDEIRSWQI